MAGGPWDKYAAQPAPATGGLEAVPLPEKPPAPKDHWRPLTSSDGSLFLNDRPGIINQVTGEVKYGPAPAKGTNTPNKQADQARSLLTAAGVDLEKGIDPVAPLIMGSTSGRLQHLGAEAYGAVSGHATSGMEDIGKLKPIVSDMVLQLTGGGLGNQVSDADRKFIIERVGNLADPDVPADQRLASWESVKQRMANILGVKVAQTRANDDAQRNEVVPPPPSGTAGSGGTSPPPSSLTPDQQAKEKAFLATNPTPDQYAAFLGVLQGGGAVDPKAAGERLKALQTGAEYNPSIGHEFAVGLGGVAEGVGDTLGIVSNPFIRAYNAVTGANVKPDMGANLRETLGLPAPRTDQEQLTATINNYGTQALTMANAARLAAARVPGVIGNALAAFGNQPLTDSASAATGGAASETVRQSGGGPVAQTVAGIVAGVPTALVGSRINALGNVRGSIPAVVEAGKREGVTVNRAMADRGLEPKVIATGKTMAGAKRMGRDMRAIGSEIEGRAQALGDGGTPLDNANLGEKVQGIGTRFIKSSGAQFRGQYGKLRADTEGVQIQPTQSIPYIDGLLAQLGKTPNTNAKEIAYLEGVRDDLANGLDVESSRNITSRLSKDIRKGEVTFGPMEADVLGLKGAVSSDIANGLTAAGKPNVAAQFKQVDNAYQQRMDFVRNTIQKLTGPRDRPLPPEQAAARIKAWASAKGDAASLEKIMAQADPDERADIAATFAESLGNGRNGGFSTNALATNAGAMPRNVRRIIFGEDGARSLDDLRLLASEHARVTKALGGSPTGLANDARTWVLNALFGGSGAVVGGTQGGMGGATVGALGTSAAVMAAKIGKDAFSARALMSPKITGWLRAAPKSDDPAAIRSWMDRLKVIAVREPALAPEVQRIQSAFLGAANSNVTPAAAASEADQGNGND